MFRQLSEHELKRLLSQNVVGTDSCKFPLPFKITAVGIPPVFKGSVFETVDASKESTTVVVPDADSDAAAEVALWLDDIVDHKVEQWVGVYLSDS
jgi:hypothetical protein